MTADSILDASPAVARFKRAAAYDWDEHVPDTCGVCATPSQTGDVLFRWGEEAPAIVHRARVATTCTKCGVVALAEGELKPSAILIYVEARHRQVEFEMLPTRLQLYVAQAFQILDEIERGVGDAASR